MSIKIQDLLYKGKLNSSTIFHLRNEKYKYFAFTSPDYTFNARNCGRGCPIMGQYEVSSRGFENQDTKWKIYGGVLFDQKEEKERPTKWVYAEGEDTNEEHEILDDDL